jgi:lipoate-protein ligase A
MLIDIDIKKLISLFNLEGKEKIIEKTKKRITSINNELNGKRISYDNVAEAMKKGFEENFKIKFINDKLRKEEIILADKLAKEKYSSKQWNLKT